ncbi:AbiJ-NTD4 domain-containing protein [Alteromonas gracilis]|uniref:AbiJ-NTD4 domain-containing protein n=1 Tax=Alteromonas gracilis TaxID=1479524 RepID=UPI003736DAE6
MKFSQRIGISPIESGLQTESMSSDLRTTLWNILDLKVWSASDFKSSLRGKPTILFFGKSLWLGYFKWPIDDMPINPVAIMKTIRQHFFEGQWYEVYEFIEFVLNSPVSSDELVDNLNLVLERELSGFRIIDSMLVQVTDDAEIESLQEALSESPFKGAQSHMKSAVQHLSRRENPDYRNSIKEAISAVESVAKEITGDSKATLGKALTKLERNKKLHPALKDAFSAMYGYTNDEGGIRHAMLDEPELTASDAKFFTVSCASFINYLKSNAVKDDKTAPKD